jgi:hypothetical protein
VVLRVADDFFSLFFVDAALLCFAYFCMCETLCALELVRQSDVFYSSVLQFYCVVQFSLCRSPWNGFILYQGFSNGTCLQVTFNESLSGAALPHPLEILRLGPSYNRPLPEWIAPPALRHLRAGGLFSLIPGAANLPDGLTHLHLGDRCNWSLQKIGLPAELQHLEMGYSFD